jgi:hypothetical protein
VPIPSARLTVKHSLGSIKTTTFLVLLFAALFLGTVSIAKAKPLSYVGGTMHSN